MDLGAGGLTPEGALELTPGNWSIEYGYASVSFAQVDPSAPYSTLVALWEFGQGGAFMAAYPDYEVDFLPVIESVFPGMPEAEVLANLNGSLTESYPVPVENPNRYFRFTAPEDGMMRFDLVPSVGIPEDALGASFGISVISNPEFLITQVYQGIPPQFNIEPNPSIDRAYWMKAGQELLAEVTVDSTGPMTLVARLSFQADELVTNTFTFSESGSFAEIVSGGTRIRPNYGEGALTTAGGSLNSVSSSGDTVTVEHDGIADWPEGTWNYGAGADAVGCLVSASGVFKAASSAPAGISLQHTISPMDFGGAPGSSFSDGTELKIGQAITNPYVHPNVFLAFNTWHKWSTSVGLFDDAVTSVSTMADEILMTRPVTRDRYYDIEGGVYEGYEVDTFFEVTSLQIYLYSSFFSIDELTTTFRSPVFPEAVPFELPATIIDGLFEGNRVRFS